MRWNSLTESFCFVKDELLSVVRHPVLLPSHVTQNYTSWRVTEQQCTMRLKFFSPYVREQKPFSTIPFTKLICAWKMIFSTRLCQLRFLGNFKVTPSAWLELSKNLWPSAACCNRYKLLTKNENYTINGFDMKWVKNPFFIFDKRNCQIRNINQEPFLITFFCQITIWNEWKLLRGRSQTTLTRFFFWPPTPCVDMFYFIIVDKKWTFLDHLLTSSSRRSFWTTLNM